MAYKYQKPRSTVAAEIIPCLCCRQPFMSENRRTNRMCAPCKADPDNDSSHYGIAVGSVIPEQTVSLVNATSLGLGARQVRAHRLPGM